MSAGARGRRRLPRRQAGRRPGFGRRAALALALAGCDAAPGLPSWLFDARTPRDRYEARLEAAGLEQSALGRDWRDAAAAALAAAPLVTSPHVESGYLSPGEPAALGYRVEARRGQEIHFDVTLHADSTTELFLDLWEVGPDSAGTLRLVASADSGLRSLRYAPRRHATFVLRAQPELLRGGRFRAELRVAPLLAFPVEGRTERDVGSRFGAPRDGGRRRHHGIDIFAPRGTPAVAGAAGVVRRVQQTELGGNVVWVRDDRGHSLYYAHLDRSSVIEGARVAAGDTIGFVGNTGNARTTPPHLHFGVYRRGEGPLDPWWFVRPLRGEAPRLAADTTLLGEWARTLAARVPLRSAPGPRATVVLEAPRHTALRVLAAVGRWYRVRLPDGTSGYLPADAVEPAATAVAMASPGSAGTVLARPSDAGAEVLDELAAGDSVSVLGHFGEYRLVRMGTGRAGWMSP